MSKDLGLTAALASSSSKKPLRLRVIGLTPSEHLMVKTVARLSSKRDPSFAVDESGVDVDVFIVDARNPAGVAVWQLEVDASPNSCTLWIGGQASGVRRMGVPHPVQWSLLPAIIARAMQSGLQPSVPVLQGTSEDTNSNLLVQSKVLSVTGATERGVIAKPKVQAVTATADILVVDDSLPIRNYMEATLRSSNLRISFAKNGEEALQMAQAQAFSCIFLDVVMPGIDGYQVCRAIKSARHVYGSPAIVMLTSKRSPFDKIRGTMSGCNAYLTKPVEKERLLELVSKFTPGFHATPSPFTTASSTIIASAR